LAKRDLSEILTPKLFDMMIRCSKVLESDAEIPAFMSEEEIKISKKDQRIKDSKAKNNREFYEKGLKLFS
jgi:hypothetical protein